MRESQFESAKVGLNSPQCQVISYKKPHEAILVAIAIRAIRGAVRKAPVSPPTLKLD